MVLVVSPCPVYLRIMGTIRFGTCSWKYASWEHLIYSVGQDSSGYLAEYAQRFDMVEIDQWFWSLGKDSAGLPRRETVLAYDAQTPSTFRFTIKCPNALTRPFHDKNDNHAEANEFFLDPMLMEQFIASLEPIREKIGLLMFQFGYLNRAAVSDQARFIGLLDRFFDALPPNLPYAIELRNPLWLNGAWFSWLRQRDIAPTLVQGYWMEDIGKTIDRFEPLIGDTVSLRLHGEDREEMEQLSNNRWDSIIHPRERELARLAWSITSLAQQGRLVYVQVNNHYEGSAPLTIDRLRALMEARDGEARDAGR